MVADTRPTIKAEERGSRQWTIWLEKIRVELKGLIRIQRVQKGVFCLDIRYMVMKCVLTGILGLHRDHELQ